MDHWNPPQDLTTAEERVLKLCRSQKLWGFMRRFRHIIVDDVVRAKLVGMYPATGPGRPPVPPEMLALAMLLQVGFGVADHEVPTLTAVDRRWQMVLNCMGSTEPAFSQGTVFNFRERARAHGLMAYLLDKTVDIARETKGFSHKRLRAIIDSSPLLGAGRVEDTFNLLGRAIAQLIDVAAAEAGRDPRELAEELGVGVALGSSVKAVLDVDWRTPGARATALRALIDQFRRLDEWLHVQFDQTALDEPPLADHIATVQQILDQDTEPEPDPAAPDLDIECPSSGDGDDRPAVIREGVAKGRLISLADRDMRHGRKSKTRVFAGYKRHVGADADVPGLIAAVEVLPANRQERDAAEPLITRLRRRFDLREVQIDRGYLTAPAIVALHHEGLVVISKPPVEPKGVRYAKSAFTADFDAGTLTCPAGVTARIPANNVVSFSTATCLSCELRQGCVTGANRRGRQVRLHPQERWYREMGAELATAEGRAKRRERTTVEHVLARVGQLQTTRARYRGLEKNQVHLEAVAVVANCYVLGALLAARDAA